MMTPADIHIPSTMVGLSKRVYDKILNSHTALSSKYKASPTTLQKVREGGIKSEMRERKETPDTMKYLNHAHFNKKIPHQSIDDIKSVNKKIKMVKKNKTIEEMLMNYTPTYNYRSVKNADKTNAGKL